MARLQDRAEDWMTGLAVAACVALAAAVLFGGYVWWSERAEATAGVLLAEALVVADAPVVPPPADAAGEADAVEPPFTQPPGSYPTIEAKMSASLPRLLETADAYPSTPSGITALYRAAAALAALGRHDEAAEHYRQVIDSDEGGVYGRMATLGLGERGDGPRRLRRGDRVARAVVGFHRGGVPARRRRPDAAGARLPARDGRTMPGPRSSASWTSSHLALLPQRGARAAGAADRRLITCAPVAASADDPPLGRPMSTGETPRFTVGLVQMACGDSAAANVETAVDLIRQAAAQGAQIVCLQELFSSRYFCQREDTANFELAEPLPGPTTARCAALAADLDVVLLVPVFERRAGRRLPQRGRGHRRRRRPAGPLPQDPRPRRSALPREVLLHARRPRLSRLRDALRPDRPLICWDQWFPEAARLSALGGADLIVYPSAIGWHPAERDTEGAAQHDAWRTVQRAPRHRQRRLRRRRQPGGTRGAAGRGLQFWGGSFVCDPAGRILAEGSRRRGTRWCWRSATAGPSSASGRDGRSSGTAAWTAMPASPPGCSTEGPCGRDSNPTGGTLGRKSATSLRRRRCRLPAGSVGRQSEPKATGTG